VSQRSVRLGLALATALALAGCGSENEPPAGTTLPGATPSPPKSPPAAAPAPAPAPAPPAAPPAAVDARAEARQIFESRCATCHGAQGAGDGPASAGLEPRPRNFRDAGWQRSVTDAHIEKIVQYGGAAVGKSPLMPPNPDLVPRPEVVAALREHVRSLAK
jgi:mono/diheme cytochrome c family protein